MLENIELSKLEIILFFYLLGIIFIYLGAIFYSFFINDMKLNHPFKFSFLPIFGIFITSNFLVIWNFFYGTANNFVILLFLFLFLLSLKRNFKLMKNFKFYFFNLTILFLSSTNIGISKDANLYHLQYQAWIRDEKIVLGISNLNPFMGYSSIIEYINSILWIKNNFIFLHFVGIYIIAAVFDLFYKLLKSKNQNYLNFVYLFLLVGSIDNFGFGGGRNGFIFIQEIFKYDHIFAALSLFFITYFFISYIEIENFEYFQIMIYMFLFLTQTRLVGHLLFLYIIFILYKNKLRIKLKQLFVPVLLYLIFLIKNMLITTCLWFPIQFTCFSFLPFSQPRQAEYISKLIINTYKLPNSSATSKILLKEFLENFISTEKSYLLNFIFTCFFIFLFFIFFRKKFIISLNQISLSLLCFLSWIILAPTYRFGVPFFLSIYFILNFKFLIETEVRIPKFLNSFPYFLLFFVIFTLVKFDSVSALKNINSIELKVEKVVIQLIDLGSGWKRSNEGLCSDYKLCYLNEFKSLKKEVLFNYYYFYPEKKDFFISILENNN